MHALDLERLPVDENVTPAIAGFNMFGHTLAPGRRHARVRAVTAALEPADARFLDRPRLGVLTTSHTSGRWATPVPVWFEWDGSAVQMFTGARAPKVRRLGVDPRASLLVVNEVAEPEHWVAFDGTVRVSSDGVAELAERLAARYWDLADAAHAATLASWKAQADGMVRLTLTPERIRRYAG